MEAGLKRKAPTTTSTPNPTLNTLESTRPTSSNVSEVVEVDSESFTKSLWLVKLPRYIAEKWKDAKNDDILGTFMVGTTPGSKPGEPPKKQMIVKLKQEDTDKGKTGDVYFLDELRKIDENEESVLALSNNPTNISGKVTRRLVMKPTPATQQANISNYLMQRQLEKQSQKKKTALISSSVLDSNYLSLATISNPNTSMISNYRTELKKKATLATAKAGESSMDMSLLKSKFFEAFEQSEMLSFESLVQYCASVPGFTKEQDLRNLLDLYARYHRRGKQAHLWELKPEFRSHLNEFEN